MKISTMTDYCILERNHNTYLYGKVKNDPRFENGHYVLSTEVSEIAIDNSYAKTKADTYYTLEKEYTHEEFKRLILKENLLEEQIAYLLKPLNRKN